MENKEKEYTFYIGNPDGDDIPYIVRESELEQSHQALLYGNLVHTWNRSSRQAQMRFMHEFILELKDAKNGE